MTDTPTTDDTQTRTDGARDAANRVYEKTVEALGSSREKAVEAAKATAKSVEANPLGILVGGIAFGAIAGALIPRSQREKELLAPAGRRIGESIRAATQAARAAGMEELDRRGLTKSAVRDQAKGLLDGALKAAATAATAGTSAAKSASKDGV